MNFQFQYDSLLEKSWQYFSEQLLRSGLGRTEAIVPREKRRFWGGGHLIGTTRMGINSADSVVDKNCRVHGIENLYVAGSSVFSAGGGANPTFTIVALSLRLADHLATKNL